MPSLLHVIAANQLDILADALAETLRSDSANLTVDPMQPEIILIQSKGMQEWISMALARRNGICANVKFPFPNTFVEQLYCDVVGPQPETKHFDPTIMAFHILELIPGLISSDAFAPLRHYLTGNQIDGKAYHLAKKIADLFDQYLVFRPDIISSWETGRPTQLPDDQTWQAILWRRICDRSSALHRSAMQKALIRRLADESTTPNLLPERIAIFGISHLPPFHLQILAALANRIPVHLFLLNPCRHYWSDILSEQQISRVRGAHAGEPSAHQDLHLEQGNRLLASWGQQGKQFFELIHQLDGQYHDLFIPRPCKTLLHHLQDDILNLVDRPAVMSDKLTLPADDSLQIHVCHSPMREVEILYDQLLEMLNNDQTLEPRDILVMTPDIKTYAPIIHAVFGSPHDERTAIPYSVADQTLPKESQLIDGFMQLLDLHQSRFEVTQVLHLLEFPAIRRKFGIAESDIDLIEQWAKAVNIRWGWDGKARGQHGLPRFESNTWRHGIDRLLLGYAMMGDDDSMTYGKLPYTEMDIGDGQTLGNFVNFAESLHRAARILAKQATLTNWHQTLLTLIDDFVAADEPSGRDLQSLRNAVEQIRHISICAPSDTKFKFEIIQDVITHTLSRATSAGGFLAGSVTFCAMLPMRSIPARVICLLGMGHDHFPQDLREPTFNLIAARPRAGDRSKRSDDKYLLLEALISARDVIYASYVGRDIQDNSSIPPSVVINELLEYAADGFGAQLEALVTEHPLQAFSTSYFDGRQSRLISYSQENLVAGQKVDLAVSESPFFGRPLPPPDEKRRECSLTQITTFFANPSRYLVEQRLGIRLTDTSDVLDDRERFNLTALDRFRTTQILNNADTDPTNPERSYHILNASGDLPHGSPGKAWHQKLQRDIDAFMQQVRVHTPSQEPTRQSLILDLPPFTINADLDAIYPGARVVHRIARTRPQDLLSIFIGHLVLLSSDQFQDQPPEKSLLICKDAIWQFDDIPNGQAILQDYLSLYWLGMREPLRFFANTSYVYATCLLDRKMTPQKSLEASAKKWQGGPFGPPPESQDPYYGLCFRGKAPLDEDFDEIAVRVFRPLLAAGRKLSGPELIGL